MGSSVAAAAAAAMLMPCSTLLHVVGRELQFPLRGVAAPPPLDQVSNPGPVVWRDGIDL